MPGQGLCCGRLEQPKPLMKMGLTVILIGHVNFMLAALVQGVVLRHIDFQKHHRALEYAISTVVTLTSGLLGIVVGILTIVLAKNKKNKCLTWTVFVFSLTSALLAGMSALGLLVAVVMAIKHHGRTLLSHCRFPDAISYSSVTNECPFDPTRIYSTTLILWLPLIVTSVVQVVFSSRCFSVCVSVLGLPCCCCCPPRRGRKTLTRSINVVTPLAADPPHSTSPQTSTLLPLVTPSPLLPPEAPAAPPLCTPPAPTCSARSTCSAPPLLKLTESPTRLSQSTSQRRIPTPLPAPPPGRPGRAAPLPRSTCPGSFITARPRPRGGP
ncbi:hypothetical protein NQD34_008259 [Periophthalmus magnuspinnatus]|nr:hypothetical protein NQD34_008259 [Periophthalmus magnuspinnatus]